MEDKTARQWENVLLTARFANAKQWQCKERLNRDGGIEGNNDARLRYVTVVERKMNVVE